MEIKNIIRSVQVSAVLLIFIGAVIGFSIEVFKMINLKKLNLQIYSYFLFMLRLWE